MISPRSRAFTLVELLATVAIMAILIALITPALGGGAAKNLTTGGNLITDLAGRARQEAAARDARGCASCRRRATRRAATTT